MAADWQASSTEGVKRCLEVETGRFLFDDGLTPPPRPPSGKTQRDHGVEGRAASGRNAGSRMRQEGRGGAWN